MTDGNREYFDGVRRDLELKNLREENMRLTSGDEWQRAKEEIERLRKHADASDREIARLQEEYEKKTEREKIKAEKQVDEWYQVALQAEKDKEKLQARTDELIAKAVAKAEKKAAKLERELEETKDRCAQQKRAKEECRTALKSVAKLVGMDHRTSGIPSSRDPLGNDRRLATQVERLCAKAINEDPTEAETKTQNAGKAKRHNRNSRVSSGLKAGGQKGHPHHPRKGLVTTGNIVEHNEKPEALEGPRTYKTKRFKSKKEVQVRVVVEVVEHIFPIWRDPDAGREMTLPIPAGLKDEINYGSTVRALALMLRYCGNVAINKVATFLRESTWGVLGVSTGWVAKQLGVFANAAKSDVLKIFQELFDSKWMHADTTVALCNGRREAISVASNGNAAYFSHTKHKGAQAVASLPCAPGLGYEGDGVTDREAAMLKIGIDHQDCLAHYFRELRRIMEVEPDKTWAKDVANLFVEMMRASSEWLRISSETGEEPKGPTKERAEKWRADLLAALEKGKKQYIEAPPTKYFLKGYNLRYILAERIENVLLFIRKPWIPNTNNEAERMCKRFKRAQHQAVTFRSSESLDDLCAFLTVTATQERKGRPVFPLLLEIMTRAGAMPDANCTQ